MAFKPALFVVDMQNEFCSPPRGASLVSGNGMDLVPPIKQLLSIPGFAMRITTVNELPDNHMSIADNHKGATPNETLIDVPNTKRGMSHKTIKKTVWNRGCVKGTWRAQLVDGLQESDFDLVVQRNTHPDVFM